MHIAAVAIASICVELMKNGMTVSISSAKLRANIYSAFTWLFPFSFLIKLIEKRTPIVALMKVNMAVMQYLKIPPPETV